MAQVEISVVVAAKDITDALPTLLLCFESQSMPTACYEVIFVSYGKVGEEALAQTEKFLAGASIAVKHLHEPSSSEAKAKNTGARQASGSLLLFLDPDLLAGPELLEKHVEVHREQGRPAIVFGQCAPHSTLPGGLLTRWFMKTDHVLMDVERPETLYHCSSRNFSMARRLFLDEKGFSEEYQAMRAADILFIKALKGKQFAPVRMPGIQAFIWHASGFKEECKRHYQEGYDLTRLALRFKDPEFAKKFGLVCSAFRFWLEELYMPFYIRTCHTRTLDMRLHGHSCRRVLTYERHRGARTALRRYAGKKY
ncbi:MAG: glycosyltransferase [Candidatus Hydrogenedens sp.]|jgi:glycosyltransferase involved in cell wall biosynthesis|nr:glycosyltransferase [Candidatus Hydrogenedens sp.]